MNNFTHSFSMSGKDVKVNRSTFNRDSRVKTTFQEGDLIPFYCDEILPGDTFKMSTSALVRMITPLTPVMDDAFLDVYYFYVPNRIIWSHWEELCGANKSTAWDSPTDWILPYLYPEVPVSVGTAYDYLGYPVGFDIGFSDIIVNTLPVVGYLKIYNDWFRDENIIAPLSVVDVFYNSSNGNALVYDGALQKAGKFHDYFTSCLPSPQKGDPVVLPLGSSAPVKTVDGGTIKYGLSGSMTGNETPVFQNSGNSSTSSVTLGVNLLKAPNNLVADLSAATAATVNDLRLAFQTQKLLERDARGGTRYIELLRSHFGVVGSDGRLQRPEYLGGFHQRLNMQQVSQTSPTTDANVGTLGAYSLTTAQGGGFVKSFEEHGFVIGLAVVRVKHSYSQGLPRWCLRHRRFDFYWPVFANIGEQPVYKEELFAVDGTNELTPFGFNEAWADYRYKPDSLTCLMRPGVTGSLGKLWTYGDLFAGAPALNRSFIEENADIMNRTVSVTSTSANPVMFKADFAISCLATRVMPLYSIPGAIDHN